MAPKMMYWTADEKWLWRRKRVRDHDFDPIHRYVNCRAPFDSNNSALDELARYTSGVQIGLGWLIAEYPLAIARGKAVAWERAAKAAVELFAGATLHTTANPT